MIALLQRVSCASVVVDSSTIGAIQRGLLIFVGVERSDSEVQAERLLQRVLTYRVFGDAQDKMNLSVRDIDGGLLLVPQFTLAADTDTGTRASFSSAAAPQLGAQLFEHFVARARAQHATVATGKFGADMQVHLVNDGPVTFWLQVRPAQILI